MRSRYAAFALGIGEYLLRTLAKKHPDRLLPRDALVRELTRARETRRFMGLRILATGDAEGGSEVMFHARVFEKGVDCSFVELSVFSREDDGWRYASGLVLPKADLPADIEALVPGDIRRVATLRHAG